MKPVRSEDSLSQIVIERPECARVLERYELDYCCRGGRTLEEACRDRGLDAGDVLASLQNAAPNPDRVDCAGLSVPALVDHIESTHHAYVWQELPRLTNLLSKVASVHRLNHPELIEAQRAFAELRAEFESHLMKEERVLFPLMRGLESRAGGAAGSAFHCGSVASPIQVMMSEHDQAGALMASLREILGGFEAPDDACTSYRALLNGLVEFESDLHDHVHKENYLLFPRALELEAAGD